MVKLKDKALAGGSVTDVSTNPKSLSAGRDSYLDIGGDFVVNELSPNKKLNYLKKKEKQPVLK